jgi:hypothetical protein
MTVSRKHVIALLRKKECINKGLMKGKDVWVTQPPHNLVITLPDTGPVPYGVVEIICVETFNMGMWEFDYWLGEIGFTI